MDTVDIDTIDDEDVLKQMWQVTEDFAEKRRIRARMYKLREKRLKDFYTSDDVMTAGSPSAASLPSQTATLSSNYTTTSATSEIVSSSSAMETDETDGINGQNRQIDQKRRNDTNQEEDAVSEKIRRKSSVRTKRYQMVLAASGGAEESSQTSTTRIETSQSAVGSSQRAMSPDSLSGSQLILADGPSLTIGPEETLNVSVLSDSSYQELKSSSHRREFQEGDILTIQEVTETWRRIRESGQSAPVTQRVTLTKTIRQRVSDGAMLEENEDEVIDDIDDENQNDVHGSGGITAVDAALRRSSIIATTTTDGIEENVTIAKKKFETGVIDDAISEPDSLDNNLPEPDSLDTHSQADSLEMTQTTFTTSMTTQQRQSNNLIRMDSDISNNSAAGVNIEEQVEEDLIVSTQSKPTRSNNSSATRSKRTPSESPSRGGGATSVSSPANKKRADSAELRKNTTTTTTTTTTSNSSSRTGLGGINRNAYSSTLTNNKSNSNNKTIAITSPNLKASSSIPRLTTTNTPTSGQKKTAMVAGSPVQDQESVVEFLQLEKEIQGEKLKNEEVKTSGIKRPIVSGNHRPMTPVTSRKTAEPVSTRTSTRVQQSSSFSSADKKGVAKKADNNTTTTMTSVTSRTSSARKELSSPSSPTKSTTILNRPAMIRTVETTRTVTVRDRDDDKPWRMNSSHNSTNRSKGISGIGRPARKDLHHNVMSVVEKYVDSEGCALHGSHPHIHDDVEDNDHHSPSPVGPAADEKSVQQVATSDDEMTPVAPQMNGVQPSEDDLATAGAEETCPDVVVVAETVPARRDENIERPKKLSVVTTTTQPMDTELATSPLNKSGSRLSIASPVLGSPSVVKKARSLFRCDSIEGPSAESSKAPVTTTTTTMSSVPTGGTASISKIRSSFESATTSTAAATTTTTIKRENTKLWEPANKNNNLNVNKLEQRPSLVKDVSPVDSSTVSSRNSCGLFTKSRSPSPIKDITAPLAALRQTTPEQCAPIAAAADDAVSVSSGQIIEEIEDLTLLENMLNTATNYDDRSRIRAHIRIVKKKLGLSISSPMPSRKAAPTPAPAAKTSFSQPSANSNQLPEMKRKPSESLQPVAVVAEPKNEPVQVKTAVTDTPVVGQQVEPITVQRADEVMQHIEISSVSTTTSEVTESTSRKTSLTQQPKVRKMSQPYDCRSETKEFVPRVAEEQPTVLVAGQMNGDSGAILASSDQEGSSETNSPRLSRTPWRRQSSEANMIKTPTHLPEPESNPETLDITSSYGTGPMDENGRPLFGLGALRRRPTKPLNITAADEGGGQQSPQPIIIERSQTLTELQKLHESQTAQSKGELEPVEKPRAKLRDTFTNSMDTEADGDRAEPIISERSQALREIIRIHEQQVSSAEATTVEAPPPSPTRPKAKLKDSFVAPIDSPDEPDQSSPMEQMIERSESFQTIIKRHQELSTSQAPSGALPSSPPMKRPGILKKPKDWSSPSPQEVPSPVKEDAMLTSSRKTSSIVEVSTTSTTMESTGTTRKASIESSIEIQLNPVQSSSIVVTEIPASGLMERRVSGATTSAAAAPNYSTIQYNSVQDIKMDHRCGSTQQQQPRKCSIEVEPSPTMHTSSITLATAAGPMHGRVVPTVASAAPFVLTGETSGHCVRSTSTFQLSTTPSTPCASRNSSVVTAPIIALSAVATVPTGDDPTPWRRKSIPREPSIPRDVEITTSAFIPTAEIQSTQSIPTPVSMANTCIQDNLPPTFVHSSPLAARSSRISSANNANETLNNFQRHGSIHHRYRPSQPENNAPFGSAQLSSEPRVKTLPATGASVRALAQKFLVTGEEKSQPQVSKSAGYPKAGLIFRSNSFRSQNNSDGTASIGLVRSESLRISPARSRVSMDRQSQERSMDRQSQERSIDDSMNTLQSRRESNTLMQTSSERRTSSSYNQSSIGLNGVNEQPWTVATPGESLTSSTMFTTTSKSFLQDRTPVRGMQDIIGRMRATDAGSGAGDDERSLSLLNKLIGAQILVQCTEQAATSAGVNTSADNLTSRPETSVQSFSSSSQHQSADGTRLSRTSTQQRTGSSFESGQDEDGGASWTRRSSSTTKFQTTRTSTVHPPQQFNITATISDDHIGNGVGGIGIGTGMAQTSTSIPGVAAAAAAGSAGSAGSAGGRAGSSVIDGIDINTCTDDFKLNELLDNCNDYETRRQIRARIKTLLGDVKVNDGDSSASCSCSASSSCHSSSCHCTANSSNVSAVHGDVMDWVRRQAQTHATPMDNNQQQPTALVVADAIANQLPPHPVAIQSQESGELFDSGTESGEDSTTQSNHSQSDLNCFMANLAQLSLEQHQSSQNCSSNSVAISQSTATASNPPSPAAGGEFLRQVDSVLDQLKTSLQPDDLAEYNGGPSADHQAVLHQHMASGGLDKQWKIHPQQQTELIGLIDRLKTSLHHLQSSDTAAANTKAVAVASATLVHPVNSSSCTVTVASTATTMTTMTMINKNEQDKRNNHVNETNDKVQKTANKMAGSTGKTTNQMAGSTGKTTNQMAGSTGKTTNQMAGSTGKTTITVASPAGSAGSMSGITCVKLRAKTFTNPPVERPVSRPNSFLLNVSHDSSSDRHWNRLSWRSSSEPNTPVTSPSPTPTASPLPAPKIHWRSPMDFLAHSTTTTTPASSFRPVWCRDNHSTTTTTAATTTTTTLAAGKIKLLEKSGIRGRFVQPELNPAPTVAQKSPAPAVRLPSFSLNKVQPASPPSASRQQSRPQTPQTPQTSVEPVTLEEPPRKADATQRLVPKQKETKQPIEGKAECATRQQDERKQETAERPIERERQPQEEDKATTTRDAVHNSSRNKSGCSHTNNTNLPWKVKLAKKRAERSQTSAGMDGQVSVDLRKSIRMAAATRKSMEDVGVDNGGLEEGERAAFKLTSQTSGYPLLKQKSLGELYAPRLPKPFQRSESVGAAASVTPLNTPEAKCSLLKKFNWNSSRSWSVESTASDVSSPPPPQSQAQPHTTPLLSPDPPSPVVLAAGLMPSQSGHSWVLSLKAAHSAVASQGATVVAPSLNMQPTAVDDEKPKAEDKEAQPCVDQVQHDANQEDEEDEEEEVVTVGVLNLRAKDERAAVQLERQTSTDLKADPSAGLFTPAETLQIAIHKAAIKASLSRQMSERNIGESSSALLSMPQSPLEEKTHPIETMIPKNTLALEAIKNHPHAQLIRATSSPKLTPPSSVCSAKCVPVTRPPAQPELKMEAPQVAVQPEKRLDSIESTKSNTNLPISLRLDPTESNKKADADTINPALQNELQKAEQYIKAAMAPMPSWKERARRSNTVAFSCASASSWRPVQAPSRLTIKTENDRKFQSLFQKNAETSSAAGFQARPLPSHPSAGGMWTNQFASIRSSFESRPSSTSTTPTQSRSRRSSADDNQSQCVAVTSAHIQFQVKPEWQKPSAPQSPLVAVKANQTKPLPPPEVKEEPHFQPTPSKVKVKEPLKSAVPMSETQEQKSLTISVAAVSSVADVPKVDTLQRSYTNGSIRSSSVGRVSALTSSSPAQPSAVMMRKRPEEKKEAPLQHVPMAVSTCSSNVPVGRVQPEKVDSPRIRTAVASAPASAPAPAATLIKSSSSRRLRNERSCSSVRTQSSLRSDSKEEDDDVDDDDDEEGDDEASSSTSSDEAQESDGMLLPTVKVQPPTPAVNSSSMSGLKNLTKILHKFSVADDTAVRHHQPNVTQQRLSASCGILKKSFSSHQIRSTTTPPAFVGTLNNNNNNNNNNDFSLSRTKSSSGFGPAAVPASSLSVTGSQSSSDKLAIPPACHYVDAPGPTLVGLVARNVTSSSAHSTAGSNNTSCIASLALNYSAANVKATTFPPSDHSPTNLLMKSVSSSRIVSGAKQQLERPKSLVLSTNTTSSLAAAEMSPGMVRRNPSLGTKQYEASLSPDSAEKKQREILQFFGTASAATAALPVAAPMLAPMLAPMAAKTIAVASSSRNNSSSRSSSVTKVNRSVLTSRQFSLDNNSCGSDVDELFNQFLSDPILSPEAAGHAFIHSNENPLSHQAVADHQPMKTSETQSNATNANSNANRFADRRRAWEASTCTSMTLHSSLMRPSESNISSRPTDMIQRSSNNNAFGSSTVQSKTEVTMTRQSNFNRSGQPGQSAFSKFQQLDQSVKSSTSGGPMQGLMGGGLSRSASGIKDFLLQWCQSRTRGYKNVQIENFSSSWNDGLAFCALIHHFYPDAFDFNQLDAKNKKHNFTLAFKTADEKAGIAPLLDVEDMVAMARPDWKCVFTYVQSFYRRFKDE